MRYDPDTVDYDLLAEAAERRRHMRRGCQCGGDMPGHCPGPANCPMCQEDNNEEES